MDAVDRSRAILKGDKDIFVFAAETGKGRYSERFLLIIRIIRGQSKNY